MTNPPTIDLLDLGHGVPPAVIVDGFAQSPETWRDEALGEGYELRGDFYPGRRKHVAASYFDDVGGRLGAIMRSVFGCRKSLKVDRALYSIVSTAPENLSLAQRIPHFDDSADNAFALVHYLSHDVFGGTAFYRHKSTGLAQIKSIRHASYWEALAGDLDALGEPGPAYVAETTAIFDQIGCADFASDRAVIYHGNQLHCPVVPLHIMHPDEPAKGRLTIAAFFRAESLGLATFGES